MNVSEESTFSESIDEKDNKLVQYQIINKQLSKTIAAFKIKISNLTNCIKQREIENLNYRNEIFVWKNKFSVLREMYFDHITSLTIQLQSNADKLNGLFQGEELSDNGGTQAGRNGRNHLSTSLPTSSKSFDTSRRISKNFASPKRARHQPQVPDEEVSELVTINEENEDEQTEHDIERQIARGPIEGRLTEKVAPSERHESVNESENESKEESREEIREDSNEESKEESREESETESKEESREESTEDSREEPGSESNEESRQESTEESNEESREESTEESREESTQESREESTSESNEESKEQSEVETNQSESEEESDEEYEEAHPNGKESESLEKHSLATTTRESTITNGDTNTEHEWPSTIVDSTATHSTFENSKSVRKVNSKSSVSVDSQSIVSVDNQSSVSVNSHLSESGNSQSIRSSNSRSRRNASQSLEQSSFFASLKKRPMTGQLSPNRSGTRLQSDVMENNSLHHLHVPDLVSSTPYQSKGKSSQAVISPISPNRIQSRSNAAAASASQSNSAMDDLTSTTTSVTGRPRRQAPAVNYGEQKLNVKLRRPRAS